jgi:hypothetical protein
VALQPASSETIKEEVRTYWRLDTGVVFLWKSASNAWQNGWRPGSTQTWTTPVNIGAGLTNVQIYPFDSNAYKPQGGHFDFDDEYYLWNRTGAADNRTKYLDRYFGFAANALQISGTNSYDASTGNVDVRYTATFNAVNGALYDVKSVLSKGNKHEILQLLGTPSPELAEMMELMDSKAQNFSPNVEGYLVFLPIVIQYDKITRVTVRNDSMEARLDLPASAAAAEDYTVSDASIVGEDLFLATAALEKHYGDGAWRPVIIWRGRSKGQNSGGSATEAHPGAGSVTYRLILTSTDGKSSTDTKTIDIQPAPGPAGGDGGTGAEPAPRDIALYAQLGLPDTTYEGHPTLASDMSEYTVDGEPFSAARAYAERIASNTFSFTPASGASSKTLSTTQREITWPTAGHYEVTLKISSAEAGKSASDTGAIEVLNTPAIAAQLGGTQKENRKQIISARIAVNPLYPLKSARIEIKDARTGEAVSLVEGGNASNSANIKSRPMLSDRSGKCFVDIEAHFLTKYGEERELGYTVHAEDIRGQSAIATGSFTVAPDLPPIPDIMLDPEFLRGPGSNVAEIRARDRSQTDSDQLERAWYVSAPGISAPAGLFHDAKALAGYRDLSFGTGMEIAFSKTGVGPVDVKLHVREVWAEETLPEYVSEADYLSAESGICSSTVGNVPPSVSLSPRRFKSAELLLMAASDADYAALLGRKNELGRRLIEAGIDARVKYIRLAPPPRDSYGIMQLSEASLPSGYNAAGTWLDSGFYSVDSSSLYTVHATWPAGDHSAYPRTPYFITSRDAYTGEIRWQYTIPESMFQAHELFGSDACRLAHDSDGRYLYFICGGSTLILDKGSGAFMAKLAFAVGPQNYLAGSSIYSVKPDGVHRIDISDGSSRLIFPATVSGPARMAGGKARFFIQQAWEAFQCVFDPEGESFSLIPLSLPADPGNRCLGIDSKGRMIISVSNGAAVNIYDSGGVLLRSFTGWKNNADNTSLAFAADEAGEATHIIAARLTRSPSAHISSVWAYDIFSDNVLKTSSSRPDDFDIDIDQMLFAIQSGNKLYVQTGINTNGIQGFGSSDLYNTARARLYTFSLAGGNPSWSQSDLFAFGGHAESFSLSGSLYAVAYSENRDTLTADNGSHIKVVEWPQSEDAILARSLSEHKSGGQTDISAALLFDSSGAFAYAGESVAFKDALGTSAFSVIVGGSGAGMPEAIAKLAGEPAASAYSVMSVKRAGGAKAGSVSRALSLAPSRAYYYEYQAKSLPQGAAGPVASAGAAGAAGQAGPVASAGAPGAADPVASAGAAGQAGATGAAGQVGPVASTGAAGQAGATGAAGPMSIDFLYSGNVPAGGLTPEKLYVIESHSENFNSTAHSSFFSYPSNRVYGGVYNGADLSQSSSYNGDVSADRSNITFSVPEGKQAALSFDYRCSFQTFLTHSPRAAHFQIDGEPWWPAFEHTSGSGSYTHSSLLGPGTHTLTSVVTGYGRMPRPSWARLDNLRLDILGSAPPPQPPTPAASAPMGDGWTQYSGSFMTPAPVSAYASQRMSAYEGTHADIPFVRLEGGDSRQGLIIDIPAGKYALSSYVIPRPGFPVYGSATYTSGPYTMKYYSDYSGERLAAKPVGSLPIGQSGSLSVRGSGSAPRVSSGFGQLGIYLVDRLNDPISDGRYFLDKPGGRVYFADPVFAGSTKVSFAASGDEELRLRGFSLYYIENGRRVDIVGGSAGDAAGSAASLGSAGDPGGGAGSPGDPAGGLAGPALWMPDNASVSIVRETPGADAGKEPGVPVYKKGGLVGYNINYSDYEDDPSLKSFWKYTHTPFNDGPHPEADAIADMRGNIVQVFGRVLNANIERFYIDGKYVAEHWQRDNTERPGSAPGVNYSAFNKDSNVEALTFYIEGGSAAPWINSITTSPASISAGEMYRIRVAVDDEEKDALSLAIEAFRDGKPVYSHYTGSIVADGAGRYPEIVSGLAPAAEPGVYSVVCTVSDASGAGLADYHFTVVSNGRIEGSVYHTEEWEKNRKRYNQKLFGEEADRQITYASYTSMDYPRQRGSNIFWSGERFMLRAFVEGSPTKVSCQIKGYPAYSAEMAGSSARNAVGERIYEGSLWDSGMINRWGRERPEELTFVFTAHYSGGISKTHEETVIIDTSDDYWQLHRLF